MVLDKRTGLYKVPAHHLQDPQPTARPSYNSMDYEAANATDEHDVENSVQKRKFQREASSAEPKTGLASLGPVFNGDMVKAVKSSVKSAREAFRSPQPAADFAATTSAAAATALSLPAPTSEPEKKKTKKETSKRKSLSTAPVPSTPKLEDSTNDEARKSGGGVTPASSISPFALPSPFPSSSPGLGLSASASAPSSPPWIGPHPFAPATFAPATTGLTSTSLASIAPAPTTPTSYMTGMIPGSSRTTPTSYLPGYIPGSRRIVVPKRVNYALTPEPASAGGSPTSVGTTPSIQEWIGRVSSSSDAENVPPAGGPSAAEIRIATNAEPQQEADIGEFVAAYTDAQYCVDFANEREFLIEHRIYRDAADSLGSLPCLGQHGSGCNPQREAILRLGLEDAQVNDDAKLGLVSVSDQHVLYDAADRNAAAEAFLAHAIVARVPVPLGRLEGQWKLFCPLYAADHMDKYGSGERVLSLQSVPSPLSAVDHRAIYKGQLNLPPRPMLYSVENFPVPPHASFRTTTVQTTVEKYKMDIVFLGNGYLLLRIDMGLMLSGEETRNEDGQPMVMEFLGVHHGAVVWEVEDD